MWYISYEAISENEYKSTEILIFLHSFSLFPHSHLPEINGDMKGCGIIHMKLFQRMRREIKSVLNSMEWGREEKEEEEEAWNARDAANSVNAAVCMSSL